MRIGDIARIGEREIPMPRFTPPVKQPSQLEERERLVAEIKLHHPKWGLVVTEATDV